MKISLGIDKEWFEKNKARLLDNGNKMHGTGIDERDSTYRIEVDINQNKERMIFEKKDMIQFITGNDEITMHIDDYVPTLEDLEFITKAVSKYDNKAKKALKSLK